MKPLLLTAILLGIVLPAHAQDQPRPEDVATLDGIIKAYYEVVSGPAGQPRDWARDQSLHHPQAQVTIISQDAAGKPAARVMTLGAFHTLSGGLSESGFFEYEIHRITERYGNTAHVWSTYEWRNTEDGPVGGRGINTIQLFWSEGRWWITSWMFDNSGKGGDIPARYLPEGDPGKS
jgi:hypothetical protein